MSGAMRKVAVYLGLVEDQERDQDDADYDGYDDADVEPDHRPMRALPDDAEREPAAVAPFPDRRSPRGRAVADQGRERAELSRIITLHPRTYNDARVIGEHFRDETPVIMNLTEMDDADAKRLVDFAAGLIFGLRGRLERVTNKVFLLSPANVTVTAEDKARIVESSAFFNQS